MHETLTNPVVTVSSRGWSVQRAWAPPLGRIVGFCALTALAAQVRIPGPGTDVPMTLQLLAVLLAGLMLRPAEAVASMALYVLCGTVGLGVFPSGSAGLLGPTGGYLLGFIAAAPLIAATRGGGSAGWGRLLVSAGLGTFVVLSLGVLWLAVWMGRDWPVAIATGVAPFALKAWIEMLLAVAVVGTVSRRRPSSLG